MNMSPCAFFNSFFCVADTETVFNYLFTLCNGAKAIIEIGGATEVYACATHGVLSGPAIERIEQSVIKELVLLDTIALPEEKKIPKITMVPVGPVFAEAIERIYADKPVSPLFV